MRKWINLVASTHAETEGAHQQEPRKHLSAYLESVIAEEAMLTEGRDAYLYHGTSLVSALGIIAANKIEGSSQYDHNPTGVSLTRDYVTARDFGTIWERQFPVVFVLDQQKLVRSRHKLLPRQDSYPKGERVPDGTTGKHIEKSGRYTVDNTPVYRGREAEEMVLSDLSPLSDYLVSINIAPQHLEQAGSDPDYYVWMSEEGHTELSRKQFFNSIHALLAHPLLNRWVPRVQWIKGAEQIPESAADQDIFWHGSPSGELRGSHYGLHLGTHEAARQALEARIGVRADGKDWDGTREYGKTLLAGRHTLARIGREESGYNCQLPEEDFYPEQREYRASYSDQSAVSMDARPSMKAYRLIGPMSNTPSRPHADFKANGYMKAAITKGNAKRGYYYENDGEDAGSISIVVPSMAHLQPVALNETYVTGFAGIRGAEAAVFRNPSAKEWKECEQYGDVRAFIVGDDLLIWSPFVAVHQMVREALNLPDTAIPLVISGSLRDEIHASVTDNSRNSPWWHNPEVVSAIQECAFVKRNFEDVEVSFYDEAIEGSWLDLENDDA